MEEKRFAEVTGGGRYFYHKFKKCEGVKHYLVEMQNVKRCSTARNYGTICTP